MHATTGGNIAQYGDRTPGIWFHSQTTKLHICSAVNGNKNYCFNSEPLPLNRASTIIVQQIQTVVGDQYHYEIIINGNKVISVLNTQPEKFDNVKYFASDPWYKPAKVSMKNFKVKKYKHKGKWYFGYISTFKIIVNIS